MLRRGVRTIFRKNGAICDGSHAYKMPGSTSAHLSNKCADDVIGPQQIRAYYLLEQRRRHEVETRHPEHARIIDDDVRCVAQHYLHLAGESLNCIRVRHVTR